MKGILSHSLNKDMDAIDSFLACMEIPSEFDARIRKECIQRLQKLIEKQNRPQLQKILQDITASFKPRNKDIIFLVNENVKPDSDPRDPIPLKMQKSLSLIIEKMIQPDDVIGLFTFRKNVTPMFNMVKTDKNKI